MYYGKTGMVLSSEVDSDGLVKVWMYVDKLPTVSFELRDLKRDSEDPLLGKEKGSNTTLQAASIVVPGGLLLTHGKHCYRVSFSVGKDPKEQRWTRIQASFGWWSPEDKDQKAFGCHIQFVFDRTTPEVTK
tara:strand:- start:2344 stop:2736 length:393 start_codon:yes stop_codon:yes gene_type:complete